MVVARVLVGLFISCPFSPTALWILWHLLRAQLTPQRVFLVGALIEFVCCFQVLIKPGRAHYHWETIKLKSMAAQAFSLGIRSRVGLKEETVRKGGKNRGRRDSGQFSCIKQSCCFSCALICLLLSVPVLKARWLALMRGNKFYNSQRVIKQVCLLQCWVQGGSLLLTCTQLHNLPEIYTM